VNARLNTAFTSLSRVATAFNQFCPRSNALQLTDKTELKKVAVAKVKVRERDKKKYW
jgi:hypothetical protein